MDPSSTTNAVTPTLDPSGVIITVIVTILATGFVLFLMIAAIVMQKQAMTKQQRAIEQQQRSLDLQEDTVMLLREISAKLGGTPLYGMKASEDRTDANRDTEIA